MSDKILCCDNYLLTYSMVQSPSWEANWFAASQEIPRISRNPKVHCRTHKRPPTVSILGQPNPGHIPTSHLLEIRPNIIHPSTPRSPQWSPSLRFPHQEPIYPPLLTHTCCDIPICISIQWKMKLYLCSPHRYMGGVVNFTRRSLFPRRQWCTLWIREWVDPRADVHISGKEMYNYIFHSYQVK